MESEVKKLSPFDFINSINTGQNGKSLMEGCSADTSDSHMDPDRVDKQYVPFIVNRGLSYFNDTVLFANEMNMQSGLPSKMQYDFLKNAIRPRKRFSKWMKKIDDAEAVKLIMVEYDYSADKARAVIGLFSADELTKLKHKYDTGGRGKR
jgi:hypothetical protein